ncbi:UNVERIFIED_CONTAM: hypothetical protein RMT77_004813 [Armadillidium vulgare]|nr:Ankyrin repeat domain-containing protein 54 [Armadillidium vulgare]
MDSGIESTESSNGSTSDTCSNSVDNQTDEGQNYSQPSDRHNSYASEDFNNPNNKCGEDFTPNNIKATFPENTNLEIELNSHTNLGNISSCTISNYPLKPQDKPQIVPVHMGDINGMQDSPIGDISFSHMPHNQSYKLKNWSNVHDGDKAFNSSSSQNFQQEPNRIDKSFNIDSSKFESSSSSEEEIKSKFMFQIPNSPVPEGCCLKLNFPNNIVLKGPLEEKAISLEKYAYVSISTGSFQDNYSKIRSDTGSLAVLPYESRELQRKFKHYRRKLRQIISTKPKEKKLRMAASLNNVELVEQLLKENVDPKAVDEKNRTALHIAASKGYTDVVRLLLQYGADPNQKDSIGNTALHLAVCTSQIETITLLLKSGTDVRQVDNQGYSPLHLAVSKLKLIKNEPGPFSDNRRARVMKIVEMIQEYFKVTGKVHSVELLEAVTRRLTISDNGPSGDEEFKELLDSLQDLKLTSSSE